jgi:hypothetical protein
MQLGYLRLQAAPGKVLSPPPPLLFTAEHGEEIVREGDTQQGVRLVLDAQVDSLFKTACELRHFPTRFG